LWIYKSGTFLNATGIPNIQKGVSLDLVSGVRLPLASTKMKEGCDNTAFFLFILG
jgi:hypothetical protein